ncbi:MAG: cytochrome P450 [Lyngbya sp. HA4199-MV5]|nr:cytochrome P450 [Lyngbya sp. HA4199-MV5]
MLLEQADHVSTTLGWFFLKSLFGNGLLFMEGEAHRMARRLMYPAFHGRAIALIPSHQNVLSHCRNCFTELFSLTGDRVSSWEKHSATRSHLTAVPQPTLQQNAPSADDG